METNDRIAGQLRQIAALLEEQGVAFKPAAYRKAAQVIEESSVDISTLKDEKKLRELPGVGEAIAKKIIEYFETGQIAFLVKLQQEQGGLSPELMMVEDLGPKRVRQVQSLGIQTVAQLIEAAEKGKLRDLERFSDTIEMKILENAKKVTERSKRFPREEVVDDVEEILSAIKKIPGVEKCEAAGSYRRHKATVGDVDILVVAKDPPRVADEVSKLSIVEKVVAKGDTKVSFNLPSLLRVDVRFVHPDEWGSALLYFTGDKEHNISLRKIAISKGWKLNEYGLFEGEKNLASKTEEEIYEKLGLKWREPEKRTGVL
jgi:DNA polymerase (family 10)